MKNFRPKQPGDRLRLQKGVAFIPWRFYSICGMLLLATVGLLWRTAWLQILHPDRLSRESDRRSLRWQSIDNPRGLICDRAGKPLAVSVPVQAIWADPQVVQQSENWQYQQHWRALAESLKLSPTQLAARIRANSGGRFVYLSRQVSPAVAQYMQALAIPGIHLNTEARRFYPAGEIAAHLVGLTNIDGLGIEGVEKRCHHDLSGQSGQRLVRQDRFGRIIEGLQATDSSLAQNITLSIDERLQRLAYRALKEGVTLHKAQAGSVILVDVQTGEILALANSPSYNPNARIKVPQAHLRNRAITDTFEPGSTVKPLVLLKALENQMVTQDSMIDTTPGTLRLKGHIVKDYRNYGLLTLEGVLKKSSNVAVSKLALAMPIQGLIERYQQFGLGISTDIGLIGEHPGLILNKRQWSDVERACFSFGYGLAVTPLQLARAYATLGGVGVARPLTFIKAERPVSGEQVAPERLVRQVLLMMEQVTHPGGIGTRAAVPGYRVAVKTGTSRIAEKGGYSRRYVSYTAGVAPVTQPRLACVVVIHEPLGGQYYGGAIAAPLFSNIMRQALRILNIEPDATEVIKLPPPLHNYSDQHYAKS
jgi:cell division protein FtsI (penicillin-binding protein 3)